MLFLTCNYIDNAEQSSFSVAILLSSTCVVMLIIIALAVGTSSFMYFL